MLILRSSYDFGLNKNVNTVLGSHKGMQLKHCLRLWNKVKQSAEIFPPGTWVETINSTLESLVQ